MEKQNGKMMSWGAFCPTCQAYVAEGDPIPNGQWVEAAARNHNRETGHWVSVGFVVEEVK